MVRPFQFKKVKQILPFLFSHFFPVHGILHEHENRFSFFSCTQEPPSRQPVNKHPWKNEKFGMSTNILLKRKKQKKNGRRMHLPVTKSKFPRQYNYKMFPQNKYCSSSYRWKNSLEIKYKKFYKKRNYKRDWL